MNICSVANVKILISAASTSKQTRIWSPNTSPSADCMRLLKAVESVSGPYAEVVLFKLLFSFLFSRSTLTVEFLYCTSFCITTLREWLCQHLSPKALNVPSTWFLYPKGPNVLKALDARMLKYMSHFKHIKYTLRGTSNCPDAPTLTLFRFQNVKWGLGN